MRDTPHYGTGLTNDILWYDKPAGLYTEGRMCTVEYERKPGSVTLPYTSGDPRFSGQAHPSPTARV